MDLFFDNLQVIHNRGQVLEENHYYPFGLTMEGISSLAADIIKNKIKFNGIEETRDFDLIQYDAFFRTYNPQIGKFLQVDPKIESAEQWSPYTSMLNNPIKYADPLGDSAIKPLMPRHPINNSSDWGYVPYNVIGSVVNGVQNIFSNISNTLNSPDPVAATVSGISGTAAGLADNVKTEYNFWTTSTSTKKLNTLKTFFSNPDNYFQAFEQATVGFSLGKLSLSSKPKKLSMNYAATAAESEAVGQVVVHGNSLKSLRPTWGYKLYTKDGVFLKNGITSAAKAESRYTKSFMSDKIMLEKTLFPDRLSAYKWEYQQNQTLRGPLNLNMH